MLIIVVDLQRKKIRAYFPFGEIVCAGLGGVQQGLEECDCLFKLRCKSREAVGGLRVTGCGESGRKVVGKVTDRVQQCYIEVESAYIHFRCFQQFFKMDFYIRQIQHPFKVLRNRPDWEGG